MTAKTRYYENAVKLVGYYERFSSEAPTMSPNLNIARRWKQLLDADCVSRLEVQDLLVSLESEDVHEGTAWGELRYWIVKWAQETCPETMVEGT